MKQQSQPKAQHLQFMLPLMETSASAIPAGKTEELVLALAELLLGAANESLAPNAETGGQNEPETDR